MPFMIKFFKSLDHEKKEGNISQGHSIEEHGHEHEQGQDQDHSKERPSIADAVDVLPENLNFKYDFLHPNFYKE